MMGRLNRNQGQLFYSFCLDEVVPIDHRVREIAGVLDLSWVHAELAPHYSHLGRPSIDPVLVIRMLIVGYVFAIRSERLLCREVQVNLAYRWFCGLSIEDKIPDHSAFSRARNERFRDSDIFRRVVTLGLVDDRDVRRDLLLVDQPVEVRGRPLGRIRRQPLRLQAEALLGPVDHGLGRAHLGLADGAGSFHIHDDAELHVDQVVVSVGEERRSAHCAGPLRGWIGW